jgi:hypothetical protein
MISSSSRDDDVSTAIGLKKFVMDGFTMVELNKQGIGARCYKKNNRLREAVISYSFFVFEHLFCSALCI